MKRTWVNGILRALGFRRAQRWWRRTFNVVATRRVNGVAVGIPRIAGMACLPSEPWMTEVLARVLPAKPGVFLDVGVNLGQTLLKVKTLDPRRTYVGFEPNPACVFYVQDLIRLNAFESCTLLPVGLFTEDRVLPLTIPAGDQANAGASLIDQFRPGAPVHARVPVPVFRPATLGSLLGDTPAGIVKIDVEGAELEVVESLADRIQTDHPWMLVEILPVYSDANPSRKTRQEKLEQLLAGWDYALLRVIKSNADAYAGIESVESIGIHGDLARCDYVAVPRAQLDEAERSLR